MAVLSAEKCIKCCWGTFTGSSIYCPFTYGACANYPETLDNPDYDNFYIVQKRKDNTLKVSQLPGRDMDFPRYFRYKNEIHTLSEWAEIKGIKIKTLRNRMSMGWNIEDAIERGIDEKKKYAEE